MMDKREVLKEVVASLERQHALMAAAARGQVDDVSKQASAMQSRYDTFRIEGSWVADGMHGREAELSRELTMAQNYAPPVANGGKIGEGNLVKLHYGDEMTNFLILPFAGGQEIDLQGEIFMIITPQSPIAAELWGKKTGAIISFRGRIIEIVEVQ